MSELLPNQVSAVVLGIMQDGGLPHIGCRCPRCTAAYADPNQAEYAACLAIVDSRPQPPSVWLIDATPDIKHQLHMLAPVLGPHPDRPDRLRQPDGIFLTHAHMGHLAGLAQLGPEAMAVQHLPVYAAAGLITLLRGTPLWRPLLARLDLVPVAAHEPVILAPDLWMTAIPVPHRDEWGAGTMAFHLQGPARSLLYLPDIDAWEQWPAARARLAAVDVALVDATFYSLDELGGRATTRSPSWQPAHPLVSHTINLFADVPGQLVLTHFNHTNPVLDRGSEERKAVLAAGVQIAQSGQVFNL